MSDAQEKTEEASQFKLDEARKKGMVPHSPDLTSFAIIAAFLVALTASGANLVRVIATHTRWWLENSGMLAVSPGHLMGAAEQSLQAIGYALLPLFAAIIIMAVLVNLLFSGFVFSLMPLKPDFKRLHPVQGLKKIFSRRMLIELGKLLVKALLFGAVLYWLAHALLPKLLGTAFLFPIYLPETLQQLIVRLGATLLAVMAVAAAWDMWMQSKEFGRQMRMSRHEVKDEYKRREGDPEIKSRRRQAQQALLKKVSALGNVKDADVILTNPTHFAVALKYRPATMVVPVVVAVGQGFLAKQICRLARRHRVPILRRPPLARELYRKCGINHPIPPATELDVAGVYRWVLAQPHNKVTA
jgi:flagellar biosynthetic protein FlhB